jgi:hypothetical protein
MTYKLTIKQGATFRQKFVYKAGASVNAATPVDLSGFTGRAQMRPDYNSTAVHAHWSTDNGGLILGGATGEITLISSAADTELMPAERGVWDLELVAPDGEVLRILEGTTEVTPEVTRPIRVPPTP